jgi:uncharacterized repeat protein (TIGR03803 family)
MCLAAVCAVTAPAQNLSVLHSFVLPAEVPYAPFTQGPDGTLYGVAYEGGDFNEGTIFKVATNGTGYTNLYNFEGGLDGANPSSSLLLVGSTLYGTASAGGSSGNGTVFSIGINGMGFTPLWEFSASSTNSAGILTNQDGAEPEAGLILNGSTLIGTTFSGGTQGNGGIFTLGTNGGNLKPLWNFSVGDYNNSGLWTNANGADPDAAVVLYGTNYFGTCFFGGVNGSGTAFRIGTDGSGFTVLKTFLAVNQATGENTGGADPYTSLIVSGGVLYGTAEQAGTAGNGTVFSLTTNGGTFTVLRNFVVGNYNAAGVYTNSDGAYPDGALLAAGGFLFGTTYAGGAGGNGSIYNINTAGTKFTNLYSFAPGVDGTSPAANLILSGATLYGTASLGGNWNTGTAFSINTNKTGYTTFYQFAGTDGVEPLGGLLLVGGALYGTSSLGGAFDSGMIFQMNTNGSGFAALTNFPAVDADTGTNNVGANPQGELVLSGGMFYGTTSSGGTNGNGAVFAIATNGSGLQALWNASDGDTNDFGMTTNADGAFPQAGLVLAAGALYGTTYQGGASGAGSIFIVNTNGTGFRILWNFSDGAANAAGIWTNADGANIQSGLVLVGTNLFGTAYQGGLNGNGTLFMLGTNGGALTVLKTFSAIDPDTGTNDDGASPFSGLLLANGTLYGTAQEGGTNGTGTIFALTTSGSFTSLWSFADTDANTSTNTGGAYPEGALVLSGNALLGTTSAGGWYGAGAIFELNTNGTDFASLHNFAFAVDGDASYANLLLAANTLWGSTSDGGISGGGTIFDISVAVVSPSLTVTDSALGFTVIWPSPSAGFLLQQSSNLTIANWSNFLGTVTDNGVTRSVTLSPSTGAFYFRLYHP